MYVREMRRRVNKIGKEHCIPSTVVGTRRECEETTKLSATMGRLATTLLRPLRAFAPITTTPLVIMPIFPLLMYQIESTKSPATDTAPF
jgi:hypothetical protein